VQLFKHIIIICIVLSGLSVAGQNYIMRNPMKDNSYSSPQMDEYLEPVVKDTVKKKKEKDKSKTKFLFGFDGRKSPVLGRSSSFSGLKIGWERFGVNKYGFGFYNMKTPIRTVHDPVPQEVFPDATDTTKFDFGYVSFFYERLWYEDHRWELSTPFHFGIGTLLGSYIDTTGAANTFFSGSSWMYEISAVAQYRLFRWFAIGGGFGYRGMLTDDHRARKALSAPVFILQFKVLLGQLGKMIFTPKRLTPWKPEKGDKKEKPDDSEPTTH